MRLQKRDNVLSVVLAVLLAYITYLTVQGTIYDPAQDMNGHTYVYIPMLMNDWMEGWMAVPYCLWHVIVIGMHQLLRIPLDVSAGYTCALFSIVSFGVIRWIIICYAEHVNAQITYNKAALIAFGLSVVQSIYIYWLDAGDDYVGPFSMNPLHNPTQMCMRPFALICMCLVYDIWNLQRNADYKGVFFKTNVGMHRLYVYLAAMLLLSSIAKPTFAEMFIPTIAFIMLFRLIAKIVGKDKLVKDYFRHCLYMLLCASPSLLYILMAFLLYFTFGGSYGGGEGLVITAFLEVWKMFTENVALSILVGMAFPLFLFLIDARFYLQNDLGIMGVVGYLIGFMEAAFLGEGGDKLSHGDFLWPMMSGMMLMFIVSILHLIDLTAKCDTYEVDMIDCGRTYKLQIFLLDIARTIFVMQVFSGMIFVIKMILG